MSAHPEAAIITVGSELTLGLRLDTNTREIAASLTSASYRVREAVSVPDSIELLAEEISRLLAAASLVVVTGGLGPTHDDVTREAAARALDRELARDAKHEEQLRGRVSRHVESRSVESVLAQADIIEGARALWPVTGTAPGQIIETGAGATLLLLPGPPHEMRPMLAEVLGPTEVATSLTLRCVRISESDAQLRTQDVLAAHPGIELTILATPSLVDIVLVAENADAGGLRLAADALRESLGTLVYAEGEATLAETVLDQARTRGLSLAVAESCTGGLIAAALTDVPGSSDVFVGGVVAYANELKRELLGVEDATLETCGAVSEETAAAMARGIARATSALVTIATTGIAGPDGGSEDKPVGLVCFGVWTPEGTRTESRQLFGDRAGVRMRATVAALDMLRLETL